ncbi:MAG TPA: DUF2188 domain-containing protein [Solirubrobacteraceae bacterium]|nr:DUF2188 domain-containing protein [Solirubrobacteraceae bacterium]
MAVKRYVKQNGQGSWDVLKEGHRRSAIQASSKEAAVRRARAIVRREGGGEVRVMSEMGKITDVRTVAGEARRNNNSSSSSTARKTAAARS